MLAFAAAVMAVAGEVCIEGYVMDRYCATRGTLLDDDSVKALERPERHTLHCLVDVGICIESGYEILEDFTTDGAHCRAFRLDSHGNDLVLALGRATGSVDLGCTTCAGNGTQQRGFRAVVVGTPQGSGSPRELAVTSVLPAGSGCPAGVPLADAAMTAEHRVCTTLNPYYVAHGSLMLLSWGLLLPAGVIVARFLRHRNPLWFKIHRVLQPCGLLVAIAGWAIALATFEHFVFLSKANGAMKAHGFLGMAVMVMGIQQPINAVLRPHKADGEATLSRRVWEWLHKGSGYAAVVLALLQVALGVLLVPMHTTAFGAAYAVVVCLLAAFIGALVVLRRKASAREASAPGAVELGLPKAQQAA